MNPHEERRTEGERETDKETDRERKREGGSPRHRHTETMAYAPATSTCFLGPHYRMTVMTGKLTGSDPHLL